MKTKRGSNFYCFREDLLILENVIFHGGALRKGGSVSMQLSFPLEPGDFRSWESPQSLPAHFIGSFEHVERFRNLKFAVKRFTNIQSTVLCSSECTAAIHLAFK